MKNTVPMIFPDSKPLSKVLILSVLVALMVRIDCLYIHTVVQDPKEYNQ